MHAQNLENSVALKVIKPKKWRTWKQNRHRLHISCKKRFAGSKMLDTFLVRNPGNFPHLATILFDFEWVKWVAFLRPLPLFHGQHLWKQLARQIVKFVDSVPHCFKFHQLIWTSKYVPHLTVLSGLSRNSNIKLSQALQMNTTNNLTEALSGRQNDTSICCVDRNRWVWQMGEQKR